VLKSKEKFTGSTFKNILKGTGLLFLGLMIILFAGSMSMSDEEIAKEEREERRIEQLKKLAEQDQEYSNVKNELNSYLQSVQRSTSECNKVPNSVKFTSLVEREINEIIINSAFMVLLIDEAPRDSGLLPYKQKIITAVDKLSDCLNRH